MFQKEIFRRYMKTHMQANVIQISEHSGLTNTYLIAKPSKPEGAPQIRTEQDLENQDVTDELIAKEFRMVVDFVGVTKYLITFNYKNFINYTSIILM